jgi:hypothetical protein
MAAVRALKTHPAVTAARSMPDSITLTNNGTSTMTITRVAPTRKLTVIAVVRLRPLKRRSGTSGSSVLA